jgi:phenylacetate-CoA ligase
MAQRFREFVSRRLWQRKLRRGAGPWAELDEFPRLRPDEQRRQLGKRLLAQLRYFASREDALPEWVEAAKVQSPEELWKVWPTLPIVSKGTLRERFEPAEMKRRFGLEGLLDASGGSTGEPTRFLHDREMLRARSAASYYTRLRMGWRPGMATIIVWGSDRDIGKSTPWRTRFYLDLCRDYTVDGYRLTPETTQRVLGLLRRHQPVAICGFTSMLEYVAREVLETRTSVEPGSVKTAWNGGEMLFREQSDVFSSAFGVAILNRYGGRELGAMACQFQADMPLSVLRPWLFAEIVDDDGKPAGPGELGHLLWTSTICRGTPFLRYDVGDLGTYEPAGATESGIHEILELHGRVGSLLRLPSGRVINNLFWNHLFKGMPEVEEFQIIDRGTSGLRILLKGKGFSPSREADCRNVLNRLLGEAPREVLWVCAIPRTSRGKLIQVIGEKRAQASEKVL